MESRTEAIINTIFLVTEKLQISKWLPACPSVSVQGLQGLLRKANCRAHLCPPAQAVALLMWPQTRDLSLHSHPVVRFPWAARLLHCDVGVTGT
jgi:hypothetical protein